MLILTRKNGESIRIGPDIVIYCLGSARTRIGIEAPSDVRILRGELESEGERLTEPEPET